MVDTEVNTIVETDNGREKSKSKSKVKVNYWTLLQLLSKKVYPAEIARRMEISKQTISNNINRLEGMGWITDLHTWPYTCRLNPQSQEFLAHPDNPQRLPNFDGHAIMVSYIIKQAGNLPKGDIDMNNWTYYMEKFGDFSIRVDYATDKKLIIFPPKRYGDTSAQVMFGLGQITWQIAEFVQDKYKCEVDPDSFDIVRRPEFHPLNDPILEMAARSGINYQGRLFKMNGSGKAYADLNGPEAVKLYENALLNMPEVENTIKQIREMLMGSMATQNAISNTVLMQTSILKLMAERERDTARLIRELTEHKVRRGHVFRHRGEE